MTLHAASIAGLSAWVCGWPRVADHCGAVLGNVAIFATGIALDSVCLAIPGKMVWSPAFIAGSDSRSSASSSWSSSTTVHTSRRFTIVTSVGTLSGKMSWLSTIVAGSATSARPGSDRTFRLDVTNALTVVALLGLGGPGQRTGSRLVSRLFAVVTQPLRIITYIRKVANIPTPSCISTTALLSSIYSHT